MGLEHLNDDQLVAGFENCTLEKAQFHHADHVRLAFLYLQRYGENAEERFLSGIRKLARHFGVSEKFHHTVTAAWMRMIAARRKPGTAVYSRWISENPELLNKDLLRVHYSDERLASEQARAGWQEPDKEPLPAVDSKS
jgi:hypothetical protein